MYEQDQDIKYSVWLSLAAIPATKGLCKLIEAFHENSIAIYHATYEELIEKGAPDPLAKRLGNKSFDEAFRIIDFCRKHDVFLLPFDSPNYPKRLRRIPDFPILLYGKGRLPIIDNEVTIATVGTRRYTEYGKQNAYVISRDLARAGAIIVSGMASGIDSFSHRGALDALGYTIAVLGCGIDVIYPKSNAELMEEIGDFGTVLTEYPPHTEPAGYNFPKRNRIISGLSLGTLVVEADAKSGAMITARLALEQGRDLFALPGNIGESTSLGTNQLIKNGARMITDAIDILKEYENVFPDKIHTERLIFKKSISRRAEPPKQLRIADPIKPLQKEPTSGSGIYALPRKKRAVNTESLEKESISPDNNNKGKKKKDAHQTPPTPSVPISIPDDLTDNEKKVLVALSPVNGMTTDEIARSGIPVAAVLVALTTLEIKKLVKSLPGGLYIRNT